MADMTNIATSTHKRRLLRLKEELCTQLVNWPQRSPQHKAMLDVLKICNDELDKIPNDNREL